MIQIDISTNLPYFEYTLHYISAGVERENMLKKKIGQATRKIPAPHQGTFKLLHEQDANWADKFVNFQTKKENWKVWDEGSNGFYISSFFVGGRNKELMWKVKNGGSGFSNVHKHNMISTLAEMGWTVIFLSYHHRPNGSTNLNGRKIDT